MIKNKKNKKQQQQQQTLSQKKKKKNNKQTKQMLSSFSLSFLLMIVISLHLKGMLRTEEDWAWKEERER